MKIIKKINNNIAVALDDHHKEMIVFGKGIGFREIPYELTDMAIVERTFYDIDERYYGLLKEIPRSIFLLITQMVDVIRQKLSEEWNPNLIFILADHINFAITREKKGLDISLPYSYELEYDYPEYTKYARWMVNILNEKLHCHLGKGEITSITMHLINACEGSEKKVSKEGTEERLHRLILFSTSIIEDHFQFKIDRKGFHYFRFKNHIKYFVQRKINGETYTDTNEKLYEDLKAEYPQTYECVCKIDAFLRDEFHEECSKEEFLYLMIHVNRLYQRGL